MLDIRNPPFLMAAAEFRVGSMNPETHEYPVERIAGEDVTVVASKHNKSDAANLAAIANYEISPRKIVTHSFHDGNISYELEDGGTCTTIGDGNVPEDFRDLVTEYWHYRRLRTLFPYFMVATPTAVQTQARFGGRSVQYVTVFDGQFAGLISSSETASGEQLMLLLESVEKSLQFQESGGMTLADLA